MRGSFLLKITSINDQVIHDTILLTFIDETGDIANDNFSLYKLRYGKTARSLTAKQIETVKKDYVGKNLTLMAYETGRFTGVPDGYFKYQPARADRGFHFEQYLVVIANIKK